jgi:sarcosine oxidase subunit beta
MVWRTADVAIVGAGIHGCSLAFFLTRQGVKRVLVVDKQYVGAGATGKSSSQVRMHYTDDPEAQLAVRSYHYFRHWADLVGGDCGFTQTGFLRLVRPEDYDNLRQNVARLQRLGVDTRVVTREEIAAIQPGLNTADVEIAAYEPTSGYAEATLCAVEFINAARAAGAELVTETRATGVRVEGSRVVGLETDRGTIATPIVAVAASVWTRDLVGPHGVDLPLYPVRHQVAFLLRPPALARGHVMVIDGTLDMYFRPHGPALTLVGAREGEVIADPDRYDEGVSEDFLLAVAEKLSYRFPPFADAGFQRGIAGFYDMTPDSKPLIGPVPGVEGLYVAAGFSGTGFKIAPATGEALAELIVAGRSQTVDLSPFRVTRFAEGQPIRGRYEYHDYISKHTRPTVA